METPGVFLYVPEIHWVLAADLLRYVCPIFLLQMFVGTTLTNSQQDVVLLPKRAHRQTSCIHHQNERFLFHPLFHFVSFRFVSFLLRFILFLFRFVSFNFVSFSFRSVSFNFCFASFRFVSFYCVTPYLPSPVLKVSTFRRLVLLKCVNIGLTVIITNSRRVIDLIGVNLNYEEDFTPDWSGPSFFVTVTT